jgi:hypothetical protein
MAQSARPVVQGPSTVVKAARRFAESGEEGLLDQRAFNGVRKVDALPFQHSPRGSRRR